MDLLQDFPGTSLIETYNEDTESYYDPFSLESGNRALDTVFEYCIGMCTYEETIIKLEKELLFSQNHENRTEKPYRGGLKKLECYHLCAFLNNLELFRETVLGDYLYDYEEYEEPIPENCDLLNKIEDLHYYTLRDMRKKYKGHLLIAELFFSSLRDISSAFSRFMHSMQNTENTKNRFSRDEIKQISTYFCQINAKGERPYKTQLMDHLLNHLRDQVKYFIKQENEENKGNEGNKGNKGKRWVLMDNEHLPLPDDVLFNHYDYPPEFSFHTLDDSLIKKFGETMEIMKVMEIMEI